MSIKKIPHKISLHGHELIDNYHWMRDVKWPQVEDKDILEYLSKENELAGEFFQQHAMDKDKIFNEIKGRIKLQDQSTYVKDGDFFYYDKIAADENYRVYCRKKFSKNTKEEIILDVNKLAKGQKFTSLGSISVSPDDKLVAFSIDHDGDERYKLKILNLATREYLNDEISDVIGSIIWHERLNGFFYNKLDVNWRHNKVFFHLLGTDASQDKLIYHEQDNKFNSNVGKSSSRKFIFISSSSANCNESYFIKMDDDDLTLHLIESRKEEIFYDLDHNKEYFYISTNDTGDNFRIVRTKIETTQKEYWEEYIALDLERYLESFDITDKYLILNYKHLGIVKPEVIELESGNKKIINFKDPVYEAGAYSTNFEENDIRLSYSSLAQPNIIYQYDFNNESLDLLKEQEIPSGFDSSLYQVERLWVDSEDVKVPVTILYKKATFNKDGINPLYLYGYGSYGISVSSSFRPSIFSLVDRGVVFAIAHIRGGEELGHSWHKQAKFLNKMRTFEDFIAVTESLISKKYSSAGNIVIAGGSAGGMLMGAVVNKKPNLYKAAILHVPFVDVLNTMLDESLPLTPGEYKEWGNPGEKEFFEYMLKYSPYENVTAQNYPNLFVTAGLSDPRVGYWEAAKFVAKLRELKTDNNMLILKTNMDFGHSGASGRFDYLKEIAEDYVFILKNLSIL